MKKIHLFILIAAAGILALTGCNRKLTPEVTDDITIQASIGNMTRVSYNGNATSFTSGDRILLYGWTGSASEVPDKRVVDGVVNTLGGDGKWTPEKQMSWKTTTDPHYFLGISPVPARVPGFTEADYTLVPSDYTSSDLLIATSLTGVKTSDGAVKLNFDHAMAKLVVNLKFLSEWEKVPVVSAVTTVARTTASVNYLTKAVTVKGDASRVALPASASAPSGNCLQFVSIMVPQSGVKEISIEIGGSEFCFEAAGDIPLKANKYTVLDLTVGKDKIGLDGITVSDWGAGADIPGGAASMEGSPEIVMSVSNTDNLFDRANDICLIPFPSAPVSTSSNSSGIMHLENRSSLEHRGILNCLEFPYTPVPAGTSHFLLYANDKGNLNVSGLADEEFSTPGNITISPRQINTSSEAQAGNSVGGNIVRLLTSLANITVEGDAPNNAWSTTGNEVLSSLYKDFITTTVSSSRSLSHILSRVYSCAAEVPSTDASYPLADAIMKTIIPAFGGTTDIKPESLGSDYSGYPGNIGLPDGAARIKWVADGLSAKTFVDQTAAWGQGLETDLTGYVYPSGMWYYANTSLKASDSVESYRFIYAGSWKEVIRDIYGSAADVVGDNTCSVALKDSIQYAVGCLDVKVSMGSGAFYDGKGKAVSTGSGFTLKGILVGGQNSVSYDFSPKGNENLVAYNGSVPDGIVATPDNTTAPVSTQVLETVDNPVVVLEFMNNGDAFAGADGVIPAGGIFYLSVKMDKPIKRGVRTPLTFTIENGQANPSGPVGFGTAINGIPDFK